MHEFERFNHLAERYFEASYRASPTTATDLGIHDYDVMLDDLSARGLRQRAKELRSFRARFDALDQVALQNGTGTDCALILSDIDSELLSIESVREWQRSPAYYVSDPLFSIYMLTSREFAPLVERLPSITARLQQLPDLLASARANLQNPPRVLTEIAIDETEGAIEFCSTLIPQLARKLPRVPRALVRASSRASRAFYDYLDYLRDELMLVSTGNLGIGADVFYSMIWVELIVGY